ncbi:2090_t:CDS:1, partial [Funneliformis geosporum]
NTENFCLKISDIISRKRFVLLAAQKHEICETKEKNPSLPNIELAQQFCIGKSTVTDILNEKEHWLAISEGQENVKKFRGL